MPVKDEFDEQTLLRTLTRVVSTLHRHDIKFAVTGGGAVYARGGPRTEHDIDILLKQSDATAAQNALVSAGMRRENPPEDWLTKVYDEGLLVDLIFRPNQRDVTDKMLDRAEPLRIGPTEAPVVTATDLMVDKLLVLGPHRCDYTPLLPVARALREQVDWAQVAREVRDSPYARALLRLLADLDICERHHDELSSTTTRVGS